MADVELARLESEVGDAEARLDHDLAWARRRADEVAAQLAQLRALGDEGPRSPPVFQESDARAHLRAARLGALERRRSACVAVRAALEAFSATAAEFANKVASDAAALRELRARPAAPPPVAPAPVAPAPVHRRSSPRCSLQASIDLCSDSNFYAGFSTNISEGGLFVATVMHPARGEVVDLRFSLPGDEVIEARGVVRWTREVNDCTPDVMPGAGIQFLELAPEAAAAIHAFTSRRDPLFFVEE